MTTLAILPVVYVGGAAGLETTSGLIRGDLGCLDRCPIILWCLPADQSIAAQEYESGEVDAAEHR